MCNNGLIRFTGKIYTHSVSTCIAGHLLLERLIFGDKRSWRSEFVEPRLSTECKWTFMLLKTFTNLPLGVNSRGTTCVVLESLDKAAVFGSLPSSSVDRER